MRMKKLGLLALCNMLCVMSFAQMSTIRGYFKTPDVKEINLFTIVDGSLVPYAKTKLGADGSFAFMFNVPQEQFYVIGGETIMDEQASVYLKPGDNAEITLDRKSILFSKNNTPENKILGEWEKMSEAVRRKSIYFSSEMSTYVDFFPAFEALIPQAAKFKEKIQTKNPKFDALMKDVVGLNMDLYAINFIQTPRTKHPTADQFPAYYAQMKTKRSFTNNDNVLNILYGSRLVSMYVQYMSRGVADLDQRLAPLTTDTQKGTYLTGQLLMYKNYEAFTKFVEKYGKYFVTPTQKLALENRGAELYDTRSGAAAANFTYPDLNGKQVSLSDFKGKVVLVDVWATWCGPCKQEIPHMKTLEKGLHGTDVVFLSVSLDEQKDHDKWKQMIADKQLGGIHLFANGWSKIAKDYKITGIPRFMVFDRNGNVVNADAPRPSTPELKILLEKELAK